MRGNGTKIQPFELRPARHGGASGVVRWFFSPYAGQKGKCLQKVAKARLSRDVASDYVRRAVNVARRVFFPVRDDLAWRHGVARRKEGLSVDEDRNLVMGLPYAEVLQPILGHVDLVLVAESLLALRFARDYFDVTPIFVGLALDLVRPMGVFKQIVVTHGALSWLGG